MWDDEFFDSLPSDIQRLDFVNKNKDSEQFIVKIPKTINRFQSLTAILFEGILNEVPKEVGDLKNLIFLSVPYNPQLKTIPDEIQNIKTLSVVNVRDCSPDFTISKELEEYFEKSGIFYLK